MGRHIGELQKIKLISIDRRGLLGKGKLCFVKHHVVRDYHTVGGTIKVAVSLMMSIVAKENTESGARS